MAILRLLSLQLVRRVVDLGDGGRLQDLAVEKGILEPGFEVVGGALEGGLDGVEGRCGRLRSGGRRGLGGLQGHLNP